VSADYILQIVPNSSGYLWKVFLIYTFRDIIAGAKILMSTYEYMRLLFYGPSSWYVRRKCEYLGNKFRNALLNVLKKWAAAAVKEVFMLGEADVFRKN
jgi:hypothetical protein